MDSKQYLEDYISKTMKTDLTVAIKTLLEELNKLERVAIETAFDKDNEDTEFLCRRLLAMGLIKLEDGVYKRNKLPYEEDGFTIDGVVYDREKVFLIEDDKLDEYTKQLEEENEKLKFKYNFRVEECNKLEKLLFSSEDSEADYIPKSKIREKIKALDDSNSKFYKRVADHTEYTLSELVRNILKELLGE